MSTPEQDLIQRFYEAFVRRDGAAMAACYAPDAHFQDAVFDLRGADIGAMWTMLTERADAGFRLEFRDVRGEAGQGGAHWEAWYRFSASGRPVHNVIEATFRFREGLIVEHIDRFGFWRWSRQALGAPGLLLGWTPFLHAKVRRTAAAGLAAWQAKANKP